MIFLKNKILLFLIIVIFLIFGLQIYFLTHSYSRDTASYATLLEGSGILISGGVSTSLSVGVPNRIIARDNIKTGSNSLVVIEWGDTSITRLGSGGSLTVQEESISQELDKIQISFSLLSGKTWSNVIPILSGDSYFKQEIGGVTASVRGTIFEVNAENGYIFAHKHQVSLTTQDSEVLTLSSDNAYSLKTSTLIDDFQEIQAFLDRNFAALNKKLDKEYIKKLKQDFIDFLSTPPLNFVRSFQMQGKISDLITDVDAKEKLQEFLDTIDSEDKRQVALDYIKTLTQMVNFSGADDEFYATKMTLKDTALEYSGDSQYISSVLSSVGYDLQDMLQLRNISQEALTDTMRIIQEQMGDLDMQQFIHNDAITDFLANFTDADISQLTQSFKEHFNLNFIPIDFETFQKDTKNLLEYFKMLFQQLFN